MNREERDAEIIRLLPYAVRYAINYLEQTGGRLPNGLDEEDVKQQARFIVVEHVNADRPAGMLKNAVMWGLRSYVRKERVSVRNAAPISTLVTSDADDDATDKIFRVDTIRPDDLCETTDTRRTIRRRVFVLTHSFPFHYRAAMRANLLSGVADSWKYSTAKYKTFAARRIKLMNRLRETLISLE